MLKHKCGTRARLPPWMCIPQEKPFSPELNLEYRGTRCPPAFHLTALLKPLKKLLPQLPKDLHFPFEIFVGDFSVRAASNCLAESGAGPALPSMICVASTFLPYSFSFAPPSGPRVVPESETPANTPCALE